jgi:thioredoxin reductase
MNQIKCPRYQKCSAAICPLWRPVIEQKMVKGERVCGVLLEYQKTESRAVLTTYYGTRMMELMAQATNQIKAHGGYLLRSALTRAAKTGSRLTLAVSPKSSTRTRRVVLALELNNQR